MENKTSKYLKYAIGEIVLVVIGILIALQINEWNNEQNRKKWEESVLLQLKTDLTKSREELDEISSMYLEMSKASASILRLFWKNEIPYEKDSLSDYLRKVRASRVYSPSLGTAKALINSGKIDLLSNPEMRTSINSYIEKVDYTLKDIARYEETYFRKAQEIFSYEVPGDIFTLEEEIKFLEPWKSPDSSKRIQRIKERGLYTKPFDIDRLPFEVDLQQLFKSKNVYIAFRWYYTAHRNRYSRYLEVLEDTDSLLKTLDDVKIH